VSDFAAVLWDLDGTIVDTEPLWIAAETELAERHHKIWTIEDALQLVGSDLLDSGEWIRERLGLTMAAVEIVDFLVERVVVGLSAHVPWRPGAVELVRDLAEVGVPQALVTMSYTAIAQPIADRLPFAAVVTGDVVPRGKPHPDPYLMAAEQLGVDPADCLAIEDSPTGAASANAAGCHVLVVPHMVTVPPAPRRTTVPTLEDLTAADFRTLRVNNSR